VLADLAGDCEAVAETAALAARGSFWDLPADTGPRLDIDAVRHEQWEVRLFAS
jgi:urease accessory protein UreF